MTRSSNDGATGAAAFSTGDGQGYLSSQVPVAGVFTAYGQIVERRSTPTMSHSFSAQSSAARDGGDDANHLHLSASSNAESIAVKEPTTPSKVNSKQNSSTDVGVNGEEATVPAAVPAAPSAAAEGDHVQ